MTMKSGQSLTYLFGFILCSSIGAQTQFQYPYQYGYQKVPDLTRKTNLTKLDYDPLAVLGTEDTYKLKSKWALTVNDQCLYEFVYQFEHPEDFPVGDVEHNGLCDFGTLDDPVKPKTAPDGIPYLKPRRYWERFPDYVWATMGFNHISVDWMACGRKPAGYRQPQYDMSVGNTKHKLLENSVRRVGET